MMTLIVAAEAFTRVSRTKENGGTAMDDTVKDVIDDIRKRVLEVKSDSERVQSYCDDLLRMIDDGATSYDQLLESASDLRYAVDDVAGNTEELAQDAKCLGKKK